MVSFIVAEKEGFEPSLRLSRTTPLAGEPLRPLGYFSIKVKFTFIFIKFLFAPSAKVTKQGDDALNKISLLASTIY